MNILILQDFVVPWPTKIAVSHPIFEIRGSSFGFSPLFIGYNIMFSILHSATTARAEKNRHERVLLTNLSIMIKPRIPTILNKTLQKQLLPFEITQSLVDQDTVTSFLIYENVYLRNVQEVHEEFPIKRFQCART